MITQLIFKLDNNNIKNFNYNHNYYQQELNGKYIR